jgi:hypothetical protein
MEAHRRAGAALFDAGRYEEARAVLRDGHLEHDDDRCGRLADLVAAFASGDAGDEREPPTFTDEDEPSDVAHLGPEALAVAGQTLATRAGQDASVLAEAGEAAEEDSGERFRALLVAYVQDGESALVAYQRLSSLIERRRARSRDVAGLFDHGETE